MHRFKSYVRNTAAPEGFIAEGYIADEYLTFCSRYLESVPMIFNRLPRNVDNTMGGISFVRLDMKTCMQAHRYILFNCDELIQIRT